MQRECNEEWDVEFVKLIDNGDFDAAWSVVRNAAESGSAMAMCQIARFYEMGLPPVEVNLNESKKWLIAARKEGEYEAILALGRMHLRPEDGVSSLSLARNYFEEAVSRWDTDRAHFGVAMSHWLNPVKSQRLFAIESFREATSRGHLVAPLLLARALFFTGRYLNAVRFSAVAFSRLSKAIWTKRGRRKILDPL